jgi:ribonucleoside-diphosphate reductase alpha chain
MGALILTLPVTHPDIEEFIDVKNDLNRVTKANISVGITDNFMESVKRDEDWTMRFVVEYDNAENVVYEKTVKARYLFRKIAESSWRTAEPGVLFWNNVNNYHINDHLKGFEYTATNP